MFALRQMSVKSKAVVHGLALYKLKTEYIHPKRLCIHMLTWPFSVYEECTMLCRNFVTVVLNHSPREANKAAHLVARHAETLVEKGATVRPL